MRSTALLIVALIVGIFFSSTTTAMSQQVDYDRLEQNVSVFRISSDVVDAALNHRRSAKVRAIAERAMAGDVDSQFRLGGCFSHDRRICNLGYQEYNYAANFPQHKFEGAWWFLRAARQGHAEAHFELAERVSIFEQKVSRNYFDAYTHFIPSVDERVEELEVRAANSEAEILDKREILVQTLALYREANRLRGLPDNNDARIGNAANFIVRHDLHVEQRAIANKRFDNLQSRIAERPDAESLYELAVLHRHGHGYNYPGYVSKGRQVGGAESRSEYPDDKYCIYTCPSSNSVFPDQLNGMPRDDIAAGLFSQAAELGHVGAQSELGRMFYFGVGVNENEDIGLGLLSLAELAGNADAVRFMKSEAALERWAEQREQQRAAFIEAGILVLQRIGEQAAFTAKVAPSTFGSGMSSDAIESTWFNVGAAVLIDPSLTR